MVHTHAGYIYYIIYIFFQMFLDTDNLIYHLIIELEATIDNILLQCNCTINLIDIENNNTAVVSKSKCREEVIKSTKHFKLYEL